MIIKHKLDNDMYKYTMLYFIWKNPDIDKLVTYRLSDRKPLFKGVSDHDKFFYLNMIRENIKYYQFTLKHTEDELKYLAELYDIEFSEYVRELDDTFPNIEVQYYMDHLSLTIEGMWSVCMLYEVPILSIINEIMTDVPLTDVIDHILEIDEFKNERYDIVNCITDFGTRRRMSFRTQEYILKSIPAIKSTSNLHFARTLNLNPIGTMAHEVNMAFQQIATNLDTFQSEFLRLWYDTFEGKFGIALTDTIGIKEFLTDFPDDLARKYSGLRHDSGCPHRFAELVKEFYDSLGIDTRSINLVFSDGLDLETTQEIYDRWNNIFNISFGIGTALVNTKTSPRWQNVLKLVSYDGRPVTKLSDTDGKNMCIDEEYNDLVKQTFGRI